MIARSRRGSGIHADMATSLVAQAALAASLGLSRATVSLAYGRFNLALGIGAAGFSEGRVCAMPARASRPAPASAAT